MVILNVFLHIQISLLNFLVKCGVHQKWNPLSREFSGVGNSSGLGMEVEFLAGWVWRCLGHFLRCPEVPLVKASSPVRQEVLLGPSPPPKSSPIFTALTRLSSQDARHVLGPFGSSQNSAIRGQFQVFRLET